MTDFPEHEKLSAISDESQAIGAFLDTCDYVLCEWGEDGFYPVRGGVIKILADYFKIDLDAIEREKRMMLNSIRTANV